MSLGGGDLVGVSSLLIFLLVFSKCLAGKFMLGVENFRMLFAFVNRKFIDELTICDYIFINSVHV